MIIPERREHSHETFGVKLKLPVREKFSSFLTLCMLGKCSILLSPSADFFQD